MFDRKAVTFLVMLLFFSISSKMVFESAIGQIIVTGEPSGSQVLQHGGMFEVGLKVKAGTNVQYLFKADSFVYFDIHSHDGTEITTLSVIESDVFEGTFVAPKDGNYYFLSMNLGQTEITLSYNISLTQNKHLVQYEGQRFDVITASNSDIDFVGFSQENKQILIMLSTPYLTPGFVKVAIPRTLIDGPFDLQGSITQYNYTQDDLSSVFTVKTPHGASDISITGTTVVPEFPVPMVFLALIVSFLLIARLKLQNFHS